MRGGGGGGGHEGYSQKQGLERKTKKQNIETALPHRMLMVRVRAHVESMCLCAFGCAHAAESSSFHFCLV